MASASSRGRFESSGSAARSSSVSRRGDAPHRRTVLDGPYAVKFLLPPPLVSAVIGRGGLVVGEMERSCQARIIILPPDGASQVQAEWRVLTARAETEEALNDVACQVVQKLANIASGGPSEVAAPDGQLKLTALIPRAAVDGFIGIGGSAIRQLCEQSSANIKVRDPAAEAGGGPEIAYKVEVKGAAQGLRHVLVEMNRQIQSSSTEPWFPAWSSTRPSDRQPRAAHAAGPVQRTLHASHSASAGSEKGDACSVDDLDLNRDLAPCIMKLSLPQVLVASVLGSGGSSLAEMRQSCQAAIRLSDLLDTHARSAYRVLTAEADAEEALNSVAQQVVEHLSRLASDAPSEPICYEGRLKMCMLVPKPAVGIIIGTRGAAIKQLCDDSGACVQVREPRSMVSMGSGSDTSFRVEIKGPAQGLEHVMKEVNRHVTSVSRESWFREWAAASPGAASPADGARAASREPRRGPRAEPGQPAVQISEAASAGIQLMNRVMEDLPQNVLEESRGFAMTCVIPVRLIGSIMGRGGTGILDVQSQTKTRIAIREIPGDEEHRSMNIAGPLLNACAAHMLMMKRYLDAEKEFFA